MTNYPRSAYGSGNPNAGRPANGDRYAWGGYAYPGGVPSSLLGTSTGTALNGQAIRVTMRKELVPLWNLLWQIAVKHGYQVWANKNGEAWGPWGYENRAISGTNNPSGHSMALSVDINAPYNPYSYTFQSDMPPGMVSDFESCGMYWGGRYENQKYDAMHFGYCYPPSSVAGHIKRAQAILGSTPTPNPDPEDWFEMASKQDLVDVLADFFGTPAGNPKPKIRCSTVKDGKETAQDATLSGAMGTAATMSSRAWISAKDGLSQSQKNYNLLNTINGKV